MRLVKSLDIEISKTRYLAARGLGLGLPPPGTGRWEEEVSIMDWRAAWDTPPWGTPSTDRSTCLDLVELCLVCFLTEFCRSFSRLTVGRFWGCWLGAGPRGGPGL